MKLKAFPSVYSEWRQKGGGIHLKSNLLKTGASRNSFVSIWLDESRFHNTKTALKYVSVPFGRALKSRKKSVLSTITSAGMDDRPILAVISFDS